MTYEVARDTLVANKPISDPRKAGKDLCEAVDKAVESLEKQIPKKPLNVIYDDDWVEFWNCPNCGIQHTAIINDEQWKFDYCPYCGQKIDWSDIE